MGHRIGSFLLVLALLLSFSMPVNACDEEQSDTYMLKLLFGDDTLSHFISHRMEISRILKA